jgi:hypothetical protein
MDPPPKTQMMSALEATRRRYAEHVRTRST